MKRKSMAGAFCPVARSLDVIGDWWSLLIVRDAFLGLRRFGEFQKSLGLAKNILTARLRHLVSEGIMETVPAADGSAYHDYVLTEKGRALSPVLVALRQWGEDTFFPEGDCRSVLVDKQSGKPVKKLEMHAQDGRLLTRDETEVRQRASIQ